MDELKGRERVMDEWMEKCGYRDAVLAGLSILSYLLSTCHMHQV